MLYDHRTYVCRPGTIKKHLALYEQHGWPVQRKHLGEPLLYAATETGDVNSYVHIWVYESAGDRESKRAKLQADPAWQNYLKLSAEAGYLISQNNKLLKPTPFFG
ncbi:NIPSNAP family protein [Nitratireductor basaltis]|uniref:NIPSNAP family containing protein n=1 Tax=Nitratireductor basaltis TaxID=472175 RepID=A0A084U8D2_9HYPH|nr:NIPSNAP family protein [Nitratireductor basaltis]KFB09218.1 NIPSNAP family containing protein [Nitratireductor basaltis]